MKNTILNTLMGGLRLNLSRNGFITYYNNIEGVGNIKVLTSYNTIIAVSLNGKIEKLSSACLCSNTTIKDLKEFINTYISDDFKYESKAKFEKVIEKFFVKDENNNYTRKA